MIEFYTGVPGSGKTYRAVSYLYDIFIDSKSKSFGKFEKFYTNINEFNFDSFPVGVAFSLDYDVLLDQLTQLHKLYLSKCTDTELIELAKTFNLENAFFIFDECHNYFERKNTVLTWWLSYHRHLHQDIILITQNLALVESKYKSFSEFFYKAIPSSLRLFGNTLKYDQYISSRMFKTQRSERISLKFNPAVYALYTSGANTQTKKVAYKYFALAGVGLVVVVVGFIAIGHYLFGGDKKKEDLNSSTPVSSSAGALSSVPAVASPVVDSPEFSIVRFVCTFEDCQSDTINFPFDVMTSNIRKYKFEVLSLERLPNNYFIYRYRVPKKFIEECMGD